MFFLDLLVEAVEAFFDNFFDVGFSGVGGVLGGELLEALEVRALFGDFQVLGVEDLGEGLAELHVFEDGGEDFGGDFAF